MEQERAMMIYLSYEKLRRPSISVRQRRTENPLRERLLVRKFIAGLEFYYYQEQQQKQQHLQWTNAAALAAAASSPSTAVAQYYALKVAQHQQQQLQLPPLPNNTEDGPAHEDEEEDESLVELTTASVSVNETHHEEILDCSEQMEIDQDRPESDEENECEEEAGIYLPSRNTKTSGVSEKLGEGEIHAGANCESSSSHSLSSDSDHEEEEDDDDDEEGIVMDSDHLINNYQRLLELPSACQSHV